MSFFFGHLIGKLTSKYRTLKTQYKLYEEEKWMKKNNENYASPNIKSNPFYWMDIVKTGVKQSAKNLYISFKYKQKMIGFKSPDGKNLPTAKEAAYKISSYSKEASLAILENLNKLIIKISFGYVNIKQVYFKYKNYSLPVLKHIKYKNLMILYRNMGNSITSLNQKTLSVLNKYRDPKAYEEFRNYYDNYVKKMDQQGRTEQKQGFTKYFQKYVPFNMKIMTNNGLKKINKYIKAPYYKQKFYNYEVLIKRFWENKPEYKKYFSYSYYKQKSDGKGITSHYYQRYQEARNVNFKDFMTGGIKRKLKKFALYLAAVLFTYYTTKYFIHKLFNRSQDKNLGEALSAINQLKSQNEELMRYNRDLMDKFKDGKRN